MLSVWVGLSNNCRLFLSRDILRGGRWIALSHDLVRRHSPTPVPRPHWSALAGHGDAAKPITAEIDGVVICVDPNSDVLTVAWADRAETGSVSQLRRLMRGLE